MIFDVLSIKLSGGNMKKILKIGAILGLLVASFASSSATYATSTTLGDNLDSPS